MLWCCHWLNIDAQISFASLLVWFISCFNSFVCNGFPYVIIDYFFWSVMSVNMILMSYYYIFFCDTETKLSSDPKLTESYGKRDALICHYYDCMLRNLEFRNHSFSNISFSHKHFCMCAVMFNTLIVLIFLLFAFIYLGSP